MTTLMYELSVPAFLHTLGNLKALLEKAVAHATAKKFDPNVFVGVRLAPDMLPLSKQIQIASDAAKGAGARLSATEAPKFEDNETTMDQLIARVEKTIVYLRTVDAKLFEGAETRTVTLVSPRQTLTFSGLNYLRHYALPNFFFHVTTTYALLRHNGVEIGKADYLGRVES
ncbi:MAG: DUF1993 domain-containing protein [Steroidobacteraceae bacterium]